YFDTSTISTRLSLPSCTGTSQRRSASANGRPSSGSGDCLRWTMILENIGSITGTCARKKGLSEDYLLIEAERFKDGRDGPCHSASFRKRFWTDVLKSLELSFDLICDEARAFNAEHRKLIKEVAEYPEEDFIPDLEERIERLRVKCFG